MDKDKLIKHLIKEKGGTREQYLSLLNAVAYHESAHTMDPTIKQQGGGPGRGKYQFEEGLNRGGITAARRTKQYLDSIGEPTPKWLQESLKGKSLDATKLTSEQQDILFLGNIRMHPTADFSNYVSGKESMDEFWANYHWAGKDKDRPARLASFNSSVSKLDPSYNNTRGKFNPTSEREYSLAKIDNTFVAPKIDYSKVKFAGQQDEVFDIVPEAKEAVTQQQQQQAQQPNLIDQIKQRAMAQKAPTGGGQFNEVNAGGTHEQNPNGGVPHGVGENGQMNTVEEGETSFDFGDDKFIFSDRISLTDYVKQAKHPGTTPNAYAMGGFVGGTNSADNLSLIDFVKKRNVNKLALGGMMQPEVAPIPEPAAPIVYEGDDVPTSFATTTTAPVTVDPPTKKPVTPPPTINVSGLANVLFNSDEEKRTRGDQFNKITGGGASTPKQQLDAQFSQIHRSADNSCLAGALNCSQDFLSKETGLPGLRTIIANSGKDFSKYYIADRTENPLKNEYKMNQNLDAWEIHEALEGEGMGKRILKPTDDVTYSKNSYLPDGFDYSQLTLGTIIGQGAGDQKYTNPKDGKRSRHSMIVVGFDDKDGMPMVYDYGKLKRLDADGILGKDHKINNITIPNEYAGYTRDKVKTLMNEEKVRLGLHKVEPVTYGSDKPHMKAIEKGVNEVRDKIAYNYGMTGSSINSLAQYIPGLANQETKVGNNEGISKSIVVDNVLGNGPVKSLLKDAKSAFTWANNFFKEDGTPKQDYQLEIEAYKKFPKDEAKFKAYFNELKEQNSQLKKKVNFKDSRNASVGPMAIKDVTEFTTKNLGISKNDLYGTFKSNEEELEVGSKAALAFLAENFAKFKKKHKDLTEEQLVKLTLVSYNNNGKASDPEFIKYYIKGNELKDNYLEKVMNFSAK